MDKRIILMTALVSVGGVAWAQSANEQLPQDGRFVARWAKIPSGHNFDEHYPPHALDKGIIGGADLCCIPLQNRTIACIVAFEYPKDDGFGEAALDISEDFVMTEASFQEFNADPSNWLQVPIRFNIWSPSPKARKETEDTFTRMRESSLGLCKSRLPAP